MKKNCIFLFICAFSMVNAQLSFEVESNRQSLSVDETLVLNYHIQSDDPAELNLEDLNLSFPDFDGFTILSTQNYNEKISVNGKNQYSMVLSLILKPEQTGKVTIPPAELFYGNTSLKSETLQITITEGAYSAEPNAVPNKHKLKQGFLAFEISNKNPYQNEGVVGRLVLYALNAFNLENVKNYTPPSFEGFNYQYIEYDNTLITKKKVKGEIFYARTLYKVLLQPIQKGKVTIDPNAAEIQINNGYMGTKNQTIHSGKIALNVKPLPPAPSNFTGAVGDFKLNIMVPKKTFKPQEALTLQLQLKGTGNFTMVQMPEVQTSQHIEKYKPSLEKKIIATVNGQTGDLIQKNVLVPLEDGELEVSISAFTYFNPKKKKYIQIPSQKVSLEVEGQPTYADNSTTNAEENSSEDGFGGLFSSDDEPTTDTLVDPQNEEDSNHGLLTWVGIGGGLMLIAIASIVLLRKKNSALVETNSPSTHATTSNSLQQEKPHFDFLTVKNAYLLHEKESMYQNIDKMLKTSREYTSHNSEMNTDYHALSTLLQQQKYSPVAADENDSKLFALSEDYYRNYFG